MVALLTCNTMNTVVLQKHINKSPSTSVVVESKPDPRRTLTKMAVAQMVADYGAGQTMREIGQRHKVSRARVSRVLTEQGVEMGCVKKSEQWVVVPTQVGALGGANQRTPAAGLPIPTAGVLESCANCLQPCDYPEIALLNRGCSLSIRGDRSACSCRHK